MTAIVLKFLTDLNYFDHKDAEFKQAVPDISLREFRVLAMVNQKPFILKEIAKERAVAAQGIGKVVERLRKRGYLQVSRLERDKRAKQVELTQSGKLVLERGTLALTTILGNQ